MSKFKGNSYLPTKNNENREFFMPCFRVNKEPKEVAEVSVEAIAALAIEHLTKHGKKGQELLAPVHFRGRSKYLAMDQGKHVRWLLEMQPVVESVIVEKETPHLMKVQAKKGGCITILLVDLVSKFHVTEDSEEAAVSEESVVASRPKKRFKQDIIALKNRARIAMGCSEDKLLKYTGVVVTSATDEEVESAVVAAVSEEEQPDDQAAVAAAVSKEEQPLDEVAPVDAPEKEPEKQPLEHPEGYKRFTTPPPKNH